MPKKVRVKRHPRRTNKGIALVRQHIRSLKLKQPRTSKIRRRFKKIRKCWNCEEELTFQAFTSRNPGESREYLERLWDDPTIELYCCSCYDVIEKPDVSMPELEKELLKVKVRKNLQKFISEDPDLFVNSQELVYWLSINKKGKIFRSSGLTPSTKPNPANWYPNTDEIIFSVMGNDEGETNDELKDYLIENPHEITNVYEDWYEDLLNKATSHLFQMIEDYRESYIQY
jgi:hypothetical protein